jgi:hypothetical protein
MVAGSGARHIEAVRKHLINRLSKEQIDQLIAITQAILGDLPA